MLFGLDGVELGLIITFGCLFAGIMSGFPVAFSIGGAGMFAFGILVMLDSSGLLFREVIDTANPAYHALVNQGISTHDISLFTYPDLPTMTVPLFDGGWQQAMDRNLSFIVNRMNERVFAGPSIETLLAVPMFVLMGIVLERSHIANDLLTTMARLFGPLPGGLAVSVVVVGAFLAASTGIVGATVVTMGLLSLPTMLRNHYSPELATGVISASGTLGQIIPPSIVIVLLGTLAGDIYSTAQETRAIQVGCPDALTYLGEPAVLSVGTLFQAALLPGIFLAFLYGLYAFLYAMFKPHNAPPVSFDDIDHVGYGRENALTWYVVVPVVLIGLAWGIGAAGVSGSQTIHLQTQQTDLIQAELRTNVSDTCKAAMIEKHGQEKWDRSVEARELQASQPAVQALDLATLSEEELAALKAEATKNLAPVSSSFVIIMVIAAIALSFARGANPMASPIPLLIGGAGIIIAIVLDALVVNPTMSSGQAFLILLLPLALIIYGLKYAFDQLKTNEIFRVVFPPLVLIVAVLGSILGGVTNPTPAAALGAAGAILLAAQRRLNESGRSTAIIGWGTLSVILMLVLGTNFDLRISLEEVTFENWVAYFVTIAAFHVAIISLIYACIVLFQMNVMQPVVRETTKVTSMVFTILIGSQLLNLVLISFGGEHYIQSFLRSFHEEWAVFLMVMAILFVLGFVLDFLEIIYIVVPIVGPVIYGGTLDPKWVTIMIAINLQTSFLTPPFGFALFYLRGVAPAEVTTGHIYRGVIPFVLIQVLGLSLLWLFPSIVTIMPSLLSN